MQTHQTHPEEFMLNVFRHFEQAREIAGSLLHGHISTDEAAARCKALKGMEHNVAVYLLELSGALPGAAVRLVHPEQLQAVQVVGDLLGTRQFQRDIAGYLWMLCEEKHRCWLSDFASILAESAPKGYLYLLNYQPQAYLLARDESSSIFNSSFIEGLVIDGRKSVINHALSAKKITTLFRQTGWAECREYMKKGPVRRELLTIEMGL